MSVKHKLEARIFLLRHYGKTFARFWKNREQLGGNLFKEQEAEFLPAALEIQEKPVSPTLRITAQVLIFLILVLLGWSVFGKMDIVVNATGEIIPHDRTKTIASIEVASVKALHVVEGQRVKKGDLLIELDASAADAEHDKATSNVTEAQLTIARSRAMIAAIDKRVPPRLTQIAGITVQKLREAQGHLDGQYLDFTAKLQRIDGAIARYTESLTLLTQQATDYKDLANNHDVPMHAYLEKEQARVDLEGQLNDAKNQRLVLIAEAKRIAYDDQTDADKILGAARQDALRNSEHSKLLKLTSPVDGTVQQLSVYTVGGVVPAAQPLMKIVPKEDTIEVEAMLENKDVAFVEEGHTAAVKIDAYEYTKYGVIPARVVHVSSDAIKDEKKGLLYSVILVLDKSSISVKGHDMPLSAGMSVRADIKTGSRRVIEYFLSPLIQHKRESLNER
ncbi:MAG: HlyD family type I secretion periplasmic adaptor subunit [Desulfuromonadaceae bacterium]|nr:HlyD family type I secretion periplasmic adaptor subunit [Desulfuromonadaceae bacterium]MDD5106174.1 HlyD family type I secretion periplasmic adaptor subunit [Desulfuromonadaceae bacterium]